MLAGTTEATAFTRAALDIGHHVTVSFAGRTSAPTSPSLDVRVGGFGGAGGLATFVRSSSFDAVVLATHPFAAVMPFNTVEACAATSTPLLRLLRPGWRPTRSDVWTRVADLHAAAAALDALGSGRVLLTTGRQELTPFVRQGHIHFVVRSIERPDVSAFASAEVVLDRGPFDVDGEAALLQTRRIDTLVTKNSGGSATRAKLDAARRVGVRVVMIERPVSPDVATVATVDAALRWLSSVGPPST